MNYWNVKKIQNNRELAYNLRTRFSFLKKVLKDEDISFVIRIILWVNKYLRVLSPTFICLLIFVAIKTNLPILITASIYFIILVTTNIETISYETKLYEVSFLLPTISSRLSFKERIWKLVFPIIMSSMSLHYIIYLIFFASCIIIRDLQIGWIGLIVLLFNFFIQIIFYCYKHNILLLNKNKLLLFSFIKSRKIYHEHTVLTILSAPFRTFFDFYRIRLKIIFMSGLCITALFISRIVTNKFSISPNIILVYYYALLPTTYNIFLKHLLFKSHFFEQSELVNYYFMKKFSARFLLAIKFVQMLNKEISILIVILTLPVIFIRGSFNPLVIIIVYTVSLLCINILNIWQKTGNLDIPIEIISSGYSGFYESIEDFFVIGSGIYIGNIVIALYIKYSTRY